MSAFICLAMCVGVVVGEVGEGRGFKGCVVESLVGCMAVVFALPLLRLGVYHVTIIRRRRTTNEDLKRIYN